MRLSWDIFASLQFFLLQQHALPPFFDGYTAKHNTGYSHLIHFFQIMAVGAHMERKDYCANLLFPFNF